MTTGQRWVAATIAALAILAMLLLAVELLAVYGGEPIVNNPRSAAARPLRVNTLYIESEAHR